MLSQAVILTIKRRFSHFVLLPMLILGLSASVSAQSRRAAEIRSCLTSEIALASFDNVDPKKSLEENFDIGKRIGYVIANFYKNAIWAMNDPDAEGSAAVLYAVENFETRAKYMSRKQLAKDVYDCRASFMK